MTGTTENRLLHLALWSLIAISVGLLFVGVGLWNRDSSPLAVGAATTIAALILLVTVWVIGIREGWPT